MAEQTVKTGQIRDGAVTEAKITLADITTNDVSTTKHGFAPKAPNDTTKFLRGDGSWAAPAGGGVIAVHKTASESVTSSTSLQDDDHFFFAIGANETWVWQINGGLDGGAGGFKWDFTLPSGASGYGNMTRGGDSSMGINVSLTTGGNAATIGNSVIRGSGYVVNSSTPGTVQFRFAQNSSSGTATTIARSSTLIAVRVA